MEPEDQFCGIHEFTARDPFSSVLTSAEIKGKARLRGSDGRSCEQGTDPGVRRAGWGVPALSSERFPRACERSGTSVAKRMSASYNAHEVVQNGAEP